MIGGTIGVGKTTITRALAELLEPECIIGTSILREVLYANSPYPDDQYYSKSLLSLAKEVLDPESDMTFDRSAIVL